MSAIRTAAPDSPSLVASPLRARSFALHRQTLILLVSAWLIASGNFSFWASVWRDTGGLRPGNASFLATLPLLVMAWTHLQLSLLAWGRAAKTVLVTALIASAAAGYFASTYGVLLDHEMIVNVVQTHKSEALDLLTWRFAGWVLTFGVIPALVVVRLHVTVGPWKRELGLQLLGMTAAAACIGTLLFAHYAQYASLLRNHRELRLMLIPHNLAAAAYGYLGQLVATSAAMEVVGPDATRAIATAGIARPRLIVLVIGETARAANFSLNGYPRETNPELARQDVVSFSNVSSCGTSTAVSVPCMFLDVGRQGFDRRLAQRREGLLDVLQRAGIRVSWIDNNSGCKGACDRVPHRMLSDRRDTGRCGGDECLDGFLLDELQTDLDRFRGDAVIVLHMQGSHGPAYFKRYPPAFEVFTPACRSSQIDQCARDSVVNAYDNSLRYTDHVLARAIELLRGQSGRFDAALLYVSDHGESLGENGVYLHGIPYALAPREQTQVPMLLWLSEGLSARQGIDVACLRRRRGEPLSHDNLFHSLLGLSEVRTAAYRPELDLFRPCSA